MPDAIVLTSTIITAGTAITAAIIRFRPTRNGRNGVNEPKNSINVDGYSVSERVCEARRQTIIQQIALTERNLSQQIQQLCQETQHMRDDLHEMARKLDDRR